jgi:hypothetical protein
MSRFIQHAFLPGAETALALSKLKIADNFCHFGRVLAGELVQVGLVPARPIHSFLAVVHALNLPGMPRQCHLQGRPG